MSELSRRGFIGSAAAAASLAGWNATADEEFSFKNNVPDPLLAGDELPTFKFELEKSEGKVIGGSSGKEATVKQLPISKGIAGVSMRLEPGAMRELHWHATAAEWAFVIEGRVRTTVIDPQGRAETNDFEPGDIWYFPRGHGHMLECLGNKPAHFILIFDNGYFSEFGTFSITDWIGHTPKHLLAKNFGLPESAFEGFHKGGREWRVGADRFPVSKTVTGVILDLEPGGLRELHWHPTSDEWQYVIEGQISVTLFGSHGRYRVETLNKGDVGYIPQGYGHSIENVGGKGCRVLIGFNTGHYEAIDLSMWIAGNPLDVLATNLGKPQSWFEKFPRERIFIAPTETPRHGDRELD